MEMNRVAKKFWSMSIVFGILTEVFKIRRISSDPHKSIEKKKEERGKSLVTIMCHLLDSPVPLAIGWGRQIGDAKIGFCHTIAAAIQSSNLYPA